MSKSRTQLVRRAVKEIGVIPLSTESYSGVTELVEGMVDSMRDRGILDYSFDTSTIEERMFQPLARCLAYWAGPEMGVSEDVQKRLAAQKMEAERDLIVMQAASPGYKPVKVDYF